MKFTHFILAGLCFFIFSCRPSAREAVEYSDSIVRHQIKIQEAENELVVATAEGDPEKMEPALQKFIQQVNASTDSVRSMENFDHKDELKKEALEFFAVYKSVGENEYAQILELFRSEYTDESHEKAMALNRQLSKMEEEALSELKKVHKKFAKEYNFTIEK